MKVSGRIIVALDGMSAEESLSMATRLNDARIPGHWGNKGNDMLLEQGARKATESLRTGHDDIGAFLDPKIHEIPKSAGNGVRKLTKAGADLITVHATGGMAMMRAAVAAAKESGSRILGVTVLTHITQADLDREFGVGVVDLRVLVRTRAELAFEAGCFGIVCAPGDLDVVAHLPPSFARVTPNVRFSLDGKGDDQNRDRQMTIEDAIAAGATLLVMGRPITEDGSPVDALRDAAEMAEAAHSRIASSS